MSKFDTQKANKHFSPYNDFKLIVNPKTVINNGCGLNNLIELYTKPVRKINFNDERLKELVSVYGVVNEYESTCNKNVNFSILIIQDLNGEFIKIKHSNEKQLEMADYKGKLSLFVKFALKRDEHNGMFILF